MGSGYVATTGACDTTKNSQCHKIADTLTVTASSNVALTNSPRIYLLSGTVPAIGNTILGSAGSAVLAQANYPATGTILNLAQTFSQICSLSAAASIAIDGSCQTTTPVVLQISILVDAQGDGIYNSGDDIITFTLTFISNIPATTAGNLGLYSFIAFPGDGEMEIQTPTFDANYPNDTAGAINSVRFYYGQATKGTEVATALPALAAAATANASTAPNNQIGVDPTTGNLATYSVQPLTNDTYYCMVAALQDNAGNIGYITDSSNFAATMCNSPSQIAGLMSKNGHCFIATAAFGSPMQSEVVTMRKFRDVFLMKSKWGRNFTSWYYKNSPPWAARLEQSENARAIARTLLWPAVGFAHLALNVGAKNACMVFAIILLFPLLLVRYYRFKNGAAKTENKIS